MTSVRWLNQTIHLASLTKPRIVVMTALTAVWGLLLAPSSLSIPHALLAVLGTSMCVGSANALNEYIERDIDGFMIRTRNRPLPAKRLRPMQALVFGVVLGLVAILILALFVNYLTAALGAAALGIYVGLYTPMKQRSAWALPVGAVAGAMPPLMGWTAATGQLGVGGVLLAAVLFVWQIPHFLAIAVFRRDDYASAGLKTVPQRASDFVVKAYVLASTITLLLVSLLLPVAGSGGVTFTVAAALAGVALTAVSLRGIRRQSAEAWARRYFGATLLYLPVLAAATVVELALGWSL